jgi:ammonium transporter, Amt family
VAERVRLWPFLIFSAVLSSTIYPIVGSWQWGGGWLSERGFSDFAGTTIVHSVGGWAGLTGAVIIGARYGRYDSQGRPTLMLGSSMPLATIGTFILWLGWFGFNGASQLAFGTFDDAVAVSKIFVNTNTSACAGVVTAMLLTQFLYKKVDLSMTLNGALAGLVSITGDPLNPTFMQAVFIGTVGASIVVFVVPLLNRLKIDDVVGAIPVHLCCGLWGTFIVPLSNPEASYATQLLGMVSVGIFVSLTSALVWYALKLSGRLVLSAEEQIEGVDFIEIGMEAYPDFVTRSR